MNAAFEFNSVPVRRIVIRLGDRRRRMTAFYLKRLDMMPMGTRRIGRFSMRQAILRFARMGLPPSSVVTTHGGRKSGGGSTGPMGSPPYIGMGMRDSIVSMTNGEICDG